MAAGKYRKKPVVIEAEQFVLGVNEDVPGVEVNGAGIHVIQTLEGPHLVNSGDWIITGVKGEKYACKPDIFQMTYELVLEPEQQ